MLLDTASLYFRAFFGVPDTMKAADGTPTDLMLAPNWLDQNAGTARCARRSVGAQIMLCVGTENDFRGRLAPGFIET